MENIVRKGKFACSKQFLLFSGFLPYITLERPYELAPGQRCCPCQFYVLARVKNMAAPTR